jgi:pimeloyl-ACP methyl ester carboxylesterase
MRRLPIGLAILATLALASGASAATHEVRVPLRDGRLSTAELLSHVRVPARCTSWMPGSVDLHSMGGSLFVAALDKALGDGCRVDVTADALVLHVDTDRLPADWDQTRLAVRTFTATAAPVATAAQAQLFGLRLPKAVDPARPLVVILHGVDMTAADMAGIDAQLAAAGYQAADFDYPPDGPIADDVALLAKHLSAVRQAFPTLTVDMVAFSMGGLVARGYVEGDGYAGGVDRLVMIATPNHGTAWADYEVLAKARDVAEQATGRDGRWHPTWLITGGLCEAGRDMTPGSKFLTELNGRPRRAGVRYTIVTGDQSPTHRIEAAVIAAPARWVPGFAQNWWGVRQARAELSSAAAGLRDKPTGGDGPVTVASAGLDGVSDVVIVHADHATIYRSVGNGPPPAWAAVRERLGRD